MTVQQLLHRASWVIPLILQGIVAALMLARGLHKRAPRFFVYLTYVVLSNAALLIIYGYPQIYFYAYWIQGLISWGLGFAVIYEIYVSLLAEYIALQKVGIYLFWIIGAVLVMIALWSALSAPGSDVSRLVQTMLILERSVRIVEFGLLLALVVFASFFGLTWKNYLFGIALGFAIFLSMQLASIAIRSYSGKNVNALFNWLQAISYNAGVLVWTFYTIRGSQGADLRSLPNTELAAWNETLRDLLHR